MPTITLSGVVKNYAGGHAAVKDLDLTVPDGSFTCLLGPSGCGKTTTLRMIAGLEQPTLGEITVGDRVLDSVERGVYVPPEKRDMGLVFQNYALWPHLTVRGNTEFGLRMRKVPAARRVARAKEALEKVRVADCMDRYPSQLSGGQQQRVALARMLAVDPGVLLLDEPLSNLDARLRLEMRTELKRIHDETGATIVFVTHDQMEAMTMATHIAVMCDGELQQVAPPMEMYRRPANRFVAEFVGSPPMNIVPAGEPAMSDLGGALLRYAGKRGELGEPGCVGIRPEALRLAGAGEAAPDPAWSEEAVVETVLPTGASWTVQLRVLDTRMFAITHEDPGAGPGDALRCWAPAQCLHLFGADGTRIGAWDEASAPVGGVAS
ncbi:ABC transporter ATP-binding protein [Actinomadura macrotermitis]|uniref:Vitamin B12 import ATP-binding protein BtuD n=1 Tax=Actinomadura macrotermitis TaxID=2585200 RepID=A0A7K0C4E4_9ACTN|nr:ABC transporter ATP-binding protein [Actinomadura macrotermitis]MQY07684.1 Vitamin B12 import ATP-binding protein BtuD [Actinomadura macrotermitis]